MKSKETIVELIEQLKFDLQIEIERDNKSEIKRLRDRIAILGWVISE